MPSDSQAIHLSRSQRSCSLLPRSLARYHDSGNHVMWGACNLTIDRDTVHLRRLANVKRTQFQFVLRFSEPELCFSFFLILFILVVEREPASPFIDIHLKKGIWVFHNYKAIVNFISYIRLWSNLIHQSITTKENKKT